MKKGTRFIMAVIAIMITSLHYKAHAQDAFIGEIRMFAGNFAPVGWLKCEGQLLPISQNTALFSILGTTYGGNGTTNFALPDLRGRVPMAPGTGNGLTNTNLGDQQGSETVTLVANNLPPHSHTLNVFNGSGNVDSLTNNSSALALPLNADLSRAAGYSSNAPNNALQATTISGNSTTNLPVPIKQPSLSVTFMICTTGIFPTHP